MLTDALKFLHSLLISDARALPDSAPRQQLAIDDPALRAQADALNAAVIAAAHAFSYIEQWEHVSCTNAIVEPLITGIKREGRQFYKAIDMSVSVAQNGHQLAQLYEYLCEGALDSTVSDRELQDFIADMKVAARKGRQDATLMKETISLTRQRFFEITKHIPSKRTQIITQRDSAINVQKDSQGSRDRMAKIGDASADLNTILSGGIATAVLSGIAIPGAVFVIPVVLPIISILSTARSNRHQNDVAERRREVASCIEALEQLDRADAYLLALCNQIDVIAKWWSMIETQLITLEANIGLLRGRGMMLKLIRNEWGKIKVAYMEYKAKIELLQDYFPSSRIRA